MKAPDHFSRGLATFAGLIVLMAGLSAARAATAPVGIDFTRQIRPILSDHCFSCHGPDEAGRKGKLRLDVKEAAFKGGKSGEPSIVPGKPDESELIQRLVTTDEEDLMPPPKTKKRLTTAQIDLLKQWIAEGAVWQSHWAFEKVERPVPPEPVNKAWARNDIDRFVAARLDKEGLKPSPEADRTALVRRVTLDLTGLPPTIDEVDAYLNDNSNGAYEKLVDRLLQSPRHGEHMAKYWMDAVRYADSHGYHIDAQRDIWPYRDWVVKAFNDNKPFDQFTVEQLAGDLLPNPTVDQKVASGYIRSNMSTGEGGAIEAEYLAKYTFDRTETMGTVWMGLTLVCARCHTHKYDPITQREYYGMYSFFHQINESIMDGNQPKPDPYLQLPSPEQKARRDELKTALATATKRIEEPVPDLDEGQAAWQKLSHARLGQGWTVLTPQAVRSAQTNGASLSVLPDRSVLAAGSMPTQEVYEVTARLAPGVLGALRLEVLPDPSLPGKGLSRAGDGRFRLAEIEAELLVPEGEGKPPKASRLRFVQSGADAMEAGGEVARAVDGNGETAWSVLSLPQPRPQTAVWVLGESATVAAETQLRVRLRFDGSSTNRAFGRFRLAAAQDAALVHRLNPPKQEPWRVIGPFKTDGLEAGFARAFEPEREIDFEKRYPGVRDELKWNARPDLADGRSHLLVHDLHGVHGAYYFHRILRLPEARNVELSLRADDLIKVWVNDQLVFQRAVPAKTGDGPARVRVDLKAGDNKILVKVVNHQGAAYFSFDKDLGDSEALTSDVAALLAATSQPGPGEAALVRDFYRRTHSAEFKQLFANRDEWRAEQEALERSIPTTLVAREMDKVRDTRMLMRGEYDKVGDVVPPSVPSILPPFPAGAPTNRLGFARWLTSPEHPLTARVSVNRFWQQIFGVGLVKTSDDFGVQGEKPSHPELLEWLSSEFVRTGWDVRGLLRMIVTSATYRQGSQFTPELLHRDPENRLLARGPRFRVDGEVLRDTALYVGGLLVEKRGGRSVKPYEPPGLWEAVSFNNSQKYVQEVGEGNYRRSLYTHWKRQSPPPNMLLFDAPTREYCVVRRPRTNTPLQALALLNDPQFVESARGLAQRMLLEGGANVDARLAYGFRLATGRRPTLDEIHVLRETLDQQLADYRKHPDAAAQFVGVGAFKAKESIDRSELAAWTTIASMLLNLDETVTKS